VRVRTLALAKAGRGAFAVLGKPASSNYTVALSLRYRVNAVNNGAVGENRTHDLSLTKFITSIGFNGLELERTVFIGSFSGDCLHK
jgi:hypothetical protein